MPALFNVFFTHWCGQVAAARFDGPAMGLMAAGVQGCAGRLLASDPSGWFANGARERRICEAFGATLDELANRFGPDMDAWTWGKLHRMPLVHVLSGRGELSELLDHGGVAVRGDICTVGNTGSGPNWIAATGGGYRLLADLSISPPVLLALDAQSQSGHPGSPHYRDQLDSWLAGDHHPIPLSREEASKLTVDRFALEQEVS